MILVGYRNALTFRAITILYPIDAQLQIAILVIVRNSVPPSLKEEERLRIRMANAQDKCISIKISSLLAQSARATKRAHQPLNLQRHHATCAAKLNAPINADIPV